MIITYTRRELVAEYKATLFRNGMKDPSDFTEKGFQNWLLDEEYYNTDESGYSYEREEDID